MADRKKTGPEMRAIGSKWIERIRAAETRDKRWIKDAESAEAQYSADSESNFGKVPEFNILHSNVETIVPATYNSTPTPDIRPKWPKEKPQTPPMGMQPPMQGRVPQPMPAMVAPASDPEKDVAELLERTIINQIDDNKMDTEVEACAQDAFLAGRGLVRVKLDADVEEFTETQEIFGPDGEIEHEELSGQTVKNERVKYEVVAWRDYREGSATRFDGVPWMAFRHYLSDEEVREMGGEDLATQTVDQLPTDNKTTAEDVAVWEIWDRNKKEVVFVRETDGAVMSTTPDPLGLSGFYPIPEPIQPIKLSAKRLPINPYVIYRTQAEELDRVTQRINAIIGGLKVRGGVIGDAENIKELAEADDNTLIPIANVEGLAQTGGLDKAIVWWPVDKAIQVLRELYIARDQIKQLIYEITGISDIVRGQSSSTETATAQQIKTQWGSVRIKKMQQLVRRHVRDLFVLSAEVIANNFTITTLQEITGMEITAEMQQILESGLRQYQIDVESDSTVRADLTRQKGEMEGFLQGTAAFFSTMAPVVQGAPQMAGPITDLFGAFARQFNLGKQAEMAVEEMGEIAKKASQGGQPDPNAEARKAETQAKMQADQAGMQLKVQEAQAKAQGDQAKLQVEMKRIEADLGIKQQQLSAAREAKAADVQIKAAELEIKQAELRLKEIDREIKQDELQFSKAKAVAEIAIEQDQRRAAKVGE